MQRLADGQTGRGGGVNSNVKERVTLHYWAEWVLCMWTQRVCAVLRRRLSLILAWKPEPASPPSAPSLGPGLGGRVLWGGGGGGGE